MNRPTMNRRRVLGVAAGSLAGAAFLAACSANSSQAATGSNPTTETGNDQKVTLYVFRGETGIKGPDGKGHDAIVPSSFVVKVGIPVQLTAINYDEGPHTLTAPDLGLNIVINPGKTVGEDVQPVTTTSTFTPAKKGVFRWTCSTTCDGGGGGWAMTAGYDGQSQDGFMAGDIVVI